MKIAIDCTSLARTKTGIGIYTHNIVRELIHLDRMNEYILLAHRHYEKGFDLSVNFRDIYPKKNVTHSTVWLMLSANHILKREEVNIFHGTNFIIPHGLHCKTISTVHDLSSLVMPERHSFMHRLSHNIFLRDSMKRADRIIAVSEFTRSEINRLFPELSPKVAVIHEAASSEYHPATNEDVGKIRDKYKLPDRFVLFVGTLEPRKNIEGLIGAFAAISDKIPEVKLVIAGGKGWLNDTIFDKVSSLGISQKVHFIGYVPQEDLPSLYSAARVFCYPSFYEGFGLPPLEAAACGTPVVTSNRSSIPEVMGDAAILVNPENIEELGEAILAATTDEDLRSRLIEKGISRTTEFSWSKTAANTLAIYEQLK